MNKTIKQLVARGRKKARTKRAADKCRIIREYEQQTRIAVVSRLDGSVIYSSSITDLRALCLCLYQSIDADVLTVVI